MWKIQEVISQSASHATCWVWRDDRLAESKDSAPTVHWAKVYTGSQAWPEFDYFCRQASLTYLVNCSGIVPLTDAVLDSDKQQPILVYPQLDLISIDQWLLQCAQRPAQAILVWLMRQTVETISAIHQMGLVHGHIQTNHVLIARSDLSVRIVGLGALEEVGTLSCLPRLASRFDAPERMHNEFEVSTAADIFSAGVLFAEILGKPMDSSPVIRAMLASEPQQRPTSAEVAALLRELEGQLFGKAISAGNNPPRLGRVA